MLRSRKSPDSTQLASASPAAPFGRRVRRHGESRHWANWGGWLLRRAVYAPRPEQVAHASMSLGLAMRLELASPVWLMARGTSMLPWRLPGCEVKLQRVEPEPEIGEILVFRRGAKLYFHRVIERVGRNQWRTKGDTLTNSDEPVSDSDIVGRVTAVRRGSRAREIRSDRSAAWLSRRLGGFFGPLGQPSGRLKRFGLRAAYLVLLLSAWPFRRLLARRDLKLGAAATVDTMEND